MKNFVDEWIKYPRIPHLAEVPRLLNHPVEIYEKMDGGNVRVRKVDGRIVCGSRANYLGNPKYFSEKWFKPFQKWALSNLSFYNLPEDVIVYGEWLARHTLEYRPEFTDKFFLIDLLDFDEGGFVRYEEAKKRLEELGIEKIIYLTSLAKGKFKLEALEKMIEKSDYRDGEREGIVIKNYDLQRFAKLWTSTVKRRFIISDEDVIRAVCSLKDEGRETNVKNIVDDILIDYQRSTTQILSLVDIDRIKLKVEKYLSSNQ